MWSSAGNRSGVSHRTEGGPPRKAALASSEGPSTLATAEESDSVFLREHNIHLCILLIFLCHEIYNLAEAVVCQDLLAGNFRSMA